MIKIAVKDLRNFLNQMESEGLNDDTILTIETKHATNNIENITTMEYSPTTDIVIFGI